MEFQTLLLQFANLCLAKVSKVQTGYLYNYALWMAPGLVVIVFFLISSIKSLGLF